jgi:hypothetical protein
VGGIAVIRLAVILTLLTAITAQAWTQEMLMGAAHGVRGESVAPPYVPTASENLKAWYTFNSGDGSYQADMSGNGNYITQATASAYATISNSAAYFGGGDWFTSATTNLMDGAGRYSITAWVYLNSIIDYAGFVTMRQSPNFSGLAFYDFAGKKLEAYHNINRLESTATYPTGSWWFASMSFVTNSSIGFVQTINGTAKIGTSAGMTALVVNNYWQIGRDGFGTRWITSGFLDDIRFYNRNLTTNEIELIRLEGRQ